MESVILKMEQEGYNPALTYTCVRLSEINGTETPVQNATDDQESTCWPKYIAGKWQKASSLKVFHKEVSHWP